MHLTASKPVRSRAPALTPGRGQSAGSWVAPQVLRTTTFDQPIPGPDDPRWVLAVRTSELLEGPILRPERRDGLVRLGRTLGLSLFDANLVIAIVQDQARRGRLPEECAAESEPRLRMIPLEGEHIRGRNAIYVACAIAAVIGLEIFALAWVVG